MMPSPEPAQYDEFGRPLHPIAAAIHNQNYSPIGATAPMPAPATQTETAIQNLPAPIHSDPAYKNSKIRTVLNAIAGGLAGASGGPRVGMEVGGELADYKYNRAMQDYKAKLSQLQGSSKIEQEQFGRGEKAYTAQTGRISAENRAESAAELNRIREENAQTSSKREQDYSRNVSSLDEQRKANEAKIKELTEKEKARNEALRKAVETKDFSEYQKSYYAPKESGEEKAKDAALVQKAKDEQSLTPTGRAASQSRNVGRITATGTPEALKAEEAAAGARAKGTEEAKTTPEMIQRQAELQHAKSVATVAQSTKTTVEGAKVALAELPNIKQNLSSASDTIFGDRWKNFRTGTLGKEDSEKYAALRLHMEMLQSLVAKIHIGSRGNSTILKKFEDMFNVDKMDKKTATDSINALQSWLNAYSRYPNAQGGIDLSNIDKLVDSGSSGEFGVIKVVR